jgi:hypothetical protein
MPTELEKNRKLRDDENDAKAFRGYENNFPQDNSYWDSGFSGIGSVISDVVSNVKSMFTTETPFDLKPMEAPVLENRIKWRRHAVIAGICAAIGGIIALVFKTDMLPTIILGGIIGAGYLAVCLLLAGIGLLVAGISLVVMILALPLCGILNLCTVGPTWSNGIPFLITGLVMASISGFIIKKSK